MRVREDYRALTGPEKAAILMLSLGEEHAARLFELMDDDEIKEISQTMANLGTVSSNLVERLFVEFAEMFSQTGSLVGSYESTERLLTKSLDKERVALIMFHESGRTFEQQRQFIDSIYELCSRYVHAGRQITDADVVDKLRVLCEQTIRCLLRLQAAHPQSAARGEGALRGRLKELDYLSAGFIAGKQPDEKHLREAFILS